MRSCTGVWAEYGIRVFHGRRKKVVLRAMEGSNVQQRCCWACVCTASGRSFATVWAAIGVWRRVPSRMWIEDETTLSAWG